MRVRELFLFQGVISSKSLSGLFLFNLAGNTKPISPLPQTHTQTDTHTHRHRHIFNFIHRTNHKPILSVLFNVIYFPLSGS